jgi:ubiquinone/menaquinone biosynthesis C-methylase UbiE
MPSIYEDKNLWEKIYAREERQKIEVSEKHHWVEGEDGEEVFNRTALRAVEIKEVIDVGCGLGGFTLRIAALARKAVGVDFSERAITKAVENAASKGIRNVEFRLSEAQELPYSNESFDVAISRRGPATDSLETTREIHRVLRRDGQLMEITIGEKDKLNWKQVFGRGQNYPFREKVATEKQDLLIRVGFRKIDVKEFETTEYFGSIKDLIKRLETTPIIPDFDKETDEIYIKEIEKAFTTTNGIRANKHRVIITATK